MCVHTKFVSGEGKCGSGWDKAEGLRGRRPLLTKPDKAATDRERSPHLLTLYSSYAKH